MSGFSNSSQQSDSWSSNSYTDFSNYTTFDSQKQNKSQDPSSYSSFPTVQDYDKQSNFSSQNQKQSDVNSTLYSAYQERNKLNNDVDDVYLYHVQNIDQNDQRSQNIRKKQNQKKITSIQPAKNLQDFTIRDVLQLPLSRQQYLKSLSLDQIGKQVQTQYLLKNPDTIFEIGFHYADSMKNIKLRNQIIMLRDKKEMIDPCLLFGLLIYVGSADYLQKHSPFTGNMRKRYHIVFPISFVLMSIYMDNSITNKRRKLLEDQNNKIEFRNVARKYLCQTNLKDRKRIIKNQQTQNIKLKSNN